MKFTVLALSPAIVLFVAYLALADLGNKNDPFLPLGAASVFAALIGLGILQRYWRARISASGRLDAGRRR